MAYDRDTMRAYQQQWYLDHREEIKLRRDAHREETKVARQKYYQEHREEIKVKVRRYREEHHEEWLAAHRRFHAANKERMNKQSRDYYREHNEQLKEYAVDYRRRLRAAHCAFRQPRLDGQAGYELGSGPIELADDALKHERMLEHRRAKYDPEREKTRQMVRREKRLTRQTQYREEHREEINVRAALYRATSVRRALTRSLESKKPRPSGLRLRNEHQKV